MTDPIRIWRFHSAPEEYQALSPHGGDEDWLVLLPLGETQDSVSWTYSGGPLGCCSVSEHQLPDGRWVLIGAHA